MTPVFRLWQSVRRCKISKDGLLSNYDLWPHLVPGVGPLGRVDQDADNFGFGNEAEHTLWDILVLKIGCTLLKQVSSGSIRRLGEELHVPETESMYMRQRICTWDYVPKTENEGSKQERGAGCQSTGQLQPIKTSQIVVCPKSLKNGSYFWHWGQSPAAEWKEVPASSILFHPCRGNQSWQVTR